MRWGKPVGWTWNCFAAQTPHHPVVMFLSAQAVHPTNVELNFVLDTASTTRMRNREFIHLTHTHVMSGTLSAFPIYYRFVSNVMKYSLYSNLMCICVKWKTIDNVYIFLYSSLKYTFDWQTYCRQRANRLILDSHPTKRSRFSSM